MFPRNAFFYRPVVDLDPHPMSAAWITWLAGAYGNGSMSWIWARTTDLFDSFGQGLLNPKNVNFVNRSEQGGRANVEDHQGLQSSIGWIDNGAYPTWNNGSYPTTYTPTRGLSHNFIGETPENIGAHGPFWIAPRVWIQGWPAPAGGTDHKVYTFDSHRRQLLEMSSFGPDTYLTDFFGYTGYIYGPHDSGMKQASAGLWDMNSVAYSYQKDIRPGDTQRPDVNAYYTGGHREGNGTVGSTASRMPISAMMPDRAELASGNIRHMMIGSYSDGGLGHIWPAPASDSTLPRVFGLATSGTTTTLVDSTASWTTNEWVGCWVGILAGTSNGSVPTIISNTATTLTFAAIGTAPDNTSRYGIFGGDPHTHPYPPEGIVMRLKQSKDISSWGRYARSIGRCLKVHGVLVGDKSRSASSNPYAYDGSYLLPGQSQVATPGFYIWAGGYDPSFASADFAGLSDLDITDFDIVDMRPVQVDFSMAAQPFPLPPPDDGTSNWDEGNWNEGDWDS
jgi:hypothetical protein